jgi:hypothetical protein
MSDIEELKGGSDDNRSVTNPGVLEHRSVRGSIMQSPKHQNQY